jgi:hypothetical protein
VNIREKTVDKTVDKTKIKRQNTHPHPNKNLRLKKTIEIVYLMVRADNFAAVKLYQQNGFETIATLEKDTKIGSQYFDGILMRKFA